MLLETLDIKKNDIIIYSQNIFNLDTNFKIIFKDDKERLSRKISHQDVCKFVNEFAPKNLIVYRLLTNIPEFKIDPSQYGFILTINDRRELIYFDPVFAVKELERYSRLMNLDDLRFRIQQLGLTTLNRKGNAPNYAEIYAIDLEAMEAKFQNDKVFVDAIMFASSPEVASLKKRLKPDVQGNSEVEEKYDTQLNSISFADRIKQSQQEFIPEKKESFNQMHHEINEDKDYDFTQIAKVDLKANVASGEIKDSGKSQKSSSQEGSITFGEFLRKKLSKENVSEDIDSRKSLTDIFKSSVSLQEYISSKEDRKIVLKLDKKPST
jgi:hypothetical protein